MAQEPNVKDQRMNTCHMVRSMSSASMYGAHCTRCDYLFDAFDTPSPLEDALMRLETLLCPRCRQRNNLRLLMPDRYREMVAGRVSAAAG